MGLNLCSSVVRRSWEQRYTVNIVFLFIVLLCHLLNLSSKAVVLFIMEEGKQLFCNELVMMRDAASQYSTRTGVSLSFAHPEVKVLVDQRV